MKLRSLIISVSLPLLFVSVSGLSMVLSKTAIRHLDFRTQYAAGYMVRIGDAPRLYDYEETKRVQNERVGQADKALPFIHLAYEALLYVPFSLFDYRVAYFLFLGVSLAFLTYAYWMLRPEMPELAEIWRYLPAALFACFLPVTMALLEGQNSILLLTLMILVAMRLERGEDTWAGIFLGLASIKFQYVIPIALLFLIWRRWRFVTGFAISAALVTGISLWLTGAAAFLSYLHTLGSMSTHFSSQNGMHLGIRPELMPNLRGLIYALGGGASKITNLITVLSSVAVFLWAATRRQSFPLALLAALLISYHETFTDATLLILPVSIALTAAWKSEIRSTYIALTCAIILVAPAILLFAGVRFYLLAVPILVLFFVWDLISTSTRAPFDNKEASLAT